MDSGYRSYDGSRNDSRQMGKARVGKQRPRVFCFRSTPLPFTSPPTDPVIMWNMFQNGAIFSSPDGTAVAVVAEVSPDQLRVLVRKKFDEAIINLPTILDFNRM